MDNVNYLVRKLMDIPWEDLFPPYSVGIMSFLSTLLVTLFGIRRTEGKRRKGHLSYLRIDGKKAFFLYLFSFLTVSVVHGNGLERICIVALSSLGRGVHLSENQLKALSITKSPEPAGVSHEEIAQMLRNREVPHNPLSAKRKLEQIERWFSRTTSRHIFPQKHPAPENYMEGLPELYDERGGLIPSHGKIHILGPGNNTLEWVAPLVARKDIQIVVSEPAMSISQMVNLAWEQLRERPALFDALPKHITNKHDFENEIRRRVTFCDSSWQAAQQNPDGFDLVSVRYPRPNWLSVTPTEEYLRGLKPNGVAWIVSEWLSPEKFFPGYPVEELAGPYADLLEKPYRDSGSIAAGSYGHYGGQFSYLLMLPPHSSEF